MLPIVLVPGLICTAEAFAPQILALWPFGPVTIASTLEGDSMAAIAANILATAPPRFAPERVMKLALMDTTARPDAPEQTANRRARVARARNGDYEAMLDELFPALVHPSRQADTALADLNRRGGLVVGVEGFARQQEAIIARPDSRPTLGAIRQPTLVIVGDSDLLTPPELAREMATAITGAQLVVIPSCGHMSTCEQPDTVNAALIAWLQRG